MIKLKRDQKTVDHNFIIDWNNEIKIYNYANKLLGRLLSVLFDWKYKINKNSFFFLFLFYFSYKSLEYLFKEERKKYLGGSHK
jgi:hypothetical protein